jgi:hypothetical protein
MMMTAALTRGRFFMSGADQPPPKIYAGWLALK